MKKPAILISTFLSLVAFDTNFFRRKETLDGSSQIEFSRDLGSESLQEKKAFRRERRDVIPARYRNIEQPVPSRCNYFSTKSRDVRDSNQRKIRRKFNNM
ncbi:MAG: hypothetical protein COT73_07635 [Bdellovibrio sp. CG10_big_fil_rev_8_21_14_0_10_47_8]|nr:MAG: hypothetical protein COT73_07635 [Bdellovibrio sp. CG10_big_fil_rev_8_21_14_0_10_47_8]